VKKGEQTLINFWTAHAEAACLLNDQEEEEKKKYKNSFLDTIPTRAERR